jgi:Spy/CpxP family protein refolding chaperone
LFLGVDPHPLVSQEIPPDGQSLENAEGAGMAAYADVNGYPGPRHVLEMQALLGLTDDQVKDIESISDEMSEKARVKGEAIIAEEGKLASVFASGTAQQDEVEHLAVTIGSLRGELRAIHLIAHIQAAQVLTDKQRELYTIQRYSAHNEKMHDRKR